MCWTGVRRRVWGLSGRLIASCTLVTFAVVVLLEALVLGYQAPQLVNDAQQQAQVIATAQSYSQQLAQRYPGGVHLGLPLGAVHKRGHLEAEYERLDQHHDDERDEDVGGDQPAR